MPKVIIAGAGLVGSLHACFFAKRGWTVEVYEFRRGEQIGMLILELSCTWSESDFEEWTFYIFQKKESRHHWILSLPTIFIRLLKRNKMLVPSKAKETHLSLYSNSIADIRTMEHVPGRSINLALSCRYVLNIVFQNND